MAKEAGFTAQHASDRWTFCGTRGDLSLLISQPGHGHMGMVVNGSDDSEIEKVATPIAEHFELTWNPDRK